MKDKAIPKSTHASSGTCNAAAESSYRDDFQSAMPESTRNNNNIEGFSPSDSNKNKNHQDSVKVGMANAMKRVSETSSLVSSIVQNIGMKPAVSTMSEDGGVRLVNEMENNSPEKSSSSKALIGAAPETTQTRAPAEEAGEQQPEAKKKRRKRAPGHPKRPLSAYNFFFKDEQNRILKSISSSSEDYYEKDHHFSKSWYKNRGRIGLIHGKIAFEDLAKLIGARWKETGPEERAPYEKLASEELHRYAIEMKEYDKIKNGYQSFVAQNPIPVPVPHVTMKTAFLPFGANNTTIRGPRPMMNNGHDDFDPADDLMHPSYYLQHLLPMQGYHNLQVASQEGLYGGGRDQQSSIQQHFFSPPEPHQLFMMMPSQIQPMMNNWVDGSRNFMNVPIGIVNYQNDTNVPLSAGSITSTPPPAPQALDSPAQLRQPIRGTNSMVNSAVKMKNMTQI